MAKFVPDIRTKRWIVIASMRLARPEDTSKDVQPQGKKCPFCPGNESETTSEVLRVGTGMQNQSGWTIRVVPNKYPITDFHEVVIHSIDHDKDIIDFEEAHIASILEVYRQRFLFYKETGQVIIFSNHGEHAGASLTHSHSQIVILPKQINLDALVREPVQNVIEETESFVSYCPDFSQWPYEVWIAPKRDMQSQTNEGLLYGDSTEVELQNLAGVLKRSLLRLYSKYKEPTIQKVHAGTPFAYNYYIHHGKNWFIRIIPRLIHRAGFELGTGLSVNVVDPTRAADELKGIGT